MSDGDIDVNQGLSVVQVSLASPTLQVQSVIQQNQQILTSQNSVIHSSGVPTIQVVRVSIFTFYLGHVHSSKSMPFYHDVRKNI